MAQNNLVAGLINLILMQVWRLLPFLSSAFKLLMFDELKIEKIELKPIIKTNFCLVFLCQKISVSISKDCVSAMRANHAYSN